MSKTESKKLTEGDCLEHQARIAIIGAGLVGSTIAFAVMLKGLAAELILIDVNEAREEGEVMDLGDGLINGQIGNICRGDLADCQNVDLVIITAGLGQKVGESRLDLITKNKAILENIIAGMGKLRPDTVVLVIANPVDVLTQLAVQLIDLPHGQVFGSGTALDTARLRHNIAKKLGVNVANVQGYVLGEHGDSEFVAWETVTVSGAPIAGLLSAGEQKEIEDKTRSAAYDIIQRKSATYYGIAAVASEIIAAILQNKELIMPVSTEPGSAYGLSGVSLGVPAILGRRGIEKIWPVALNSESQDKLKHSAQILQDFLK
ncbi:MAG: L-lactate dehydrogenase [Candidatus Komeilibacteria bacterium]|nr:L-lactate dehydrogenase [Candidatus Komeilibacteria bacterium]